MSPTGRQCNALYDVIPVTIVVHVEADRLPLFLEILGRKRFITAYNVNLAAVDSVVLNATQNLMYGSAPVVQATINCEVLMLRSWTQPLMPQPVQDQLGIKETAPAQ